MPFASETVSSNGSGLIFVNSYGDGVTAAYRANIIAAENYLQAHFTNSVTLNLRFDLQALDPKFGGQNQFSPVTVSYSSLRNALTSHATTADDLLAVNSLPTTDPSGGRGFAVPVGMARILGLAGPGQGIDDYIVLNSRSGWTYGQDVVGTLLHEITEGGMGRIGSLGYKMGGAFGPMDLFRFTASGQHDYSGGTDNIATYFGLNPTHLSTLQFHNSVSAYGVFDGYDFADWDRTIGDAFGPGGGGIASTMSTVDLQVMDILGWTPSGSAPPPANASDDYANSLTDSSHPTGRVTVNGSATGTIGVAGDHDLFAVQLTAGVSYTITMRGQPSGAGTLSDTYLRLRNSSGALVAENDDITTNVNLDSQIVYVPTTTGTFYLDAGAYNDTLTGSYTVRVAGLVPTDDYAGALNDTKPYGQLVAGGSATGSLEQVGDHDWFRVQLVAGARYTLSLTGSQGGGGTLSDPYLRLRNASGTVVAENDDTVVGSNLDSQVSYVALTSGVYYVDVGAFDDALAGTYRLTLAAGGGSGDDFASSLSDTSHPFGTVTVGATATGVLEAVADRDWYRVQLTAGLSYTFNLQGQSTGGGTLEDPYLRLRSSTGSVLVENDDIATGADAAGGNLDSRIVFQPTVTGVYYLEAGSYADNGTGTFRITSSSAQAIPDDFANAISDAVHPYGAVAVNGSATGNLEYTGDHDWFRVQLSAGVNYSISLLGQQGAGGTLADPYLRLRDSAGTLLTANDDMITDENVDSRLTFHASTTGTYYLDVGSYSDRYAGTYRVTVLAGAPAATSGNDVLVGGAGPATLQGGAGNDTVVGAASASNYLRGDDGADSVVGGALFDDINGNMGNDTANGGLGDDWVVGGKDQDLLYGDVGDDIVYGNLGNDTCIGGVGADLIRGGQGDDIVSGDDGDDWLSGDRGNDTVTGGLGADIFHGSQDAGIDRITDFDRSEGDRVQLDAGTIYTVSQVGADTVISMGGANQMILVGVRMSSLTPGWIFGA